MAEENDMPTTLSDIFETPNVNNGELGRDTPTDGATMPVNVANNENISTAVENDMPTSLRDIFESPNVNYDELGRDTTADDATITMQVNGANNDNVTMAEENYMPTTNNANNTMAELNDMPTSLRDRFEIPNVQNDELGRDPTEHDATIPFKGAANNDNFSTAGDGPIPFNGANYENACRSDNNDVLTGIASSWVSSREILETPTASNNEFGVETTNADATHANATHADATHTDATILVTNGADLANAEESGIPTQSRARFHESLAVSYNELDIDTTDDDDGRILMTNGVKHRNKLLMRRRETGIVALRMYKITDSALYLPVTFFFIFLVSLVCVSLCAITVKRPTPMNCPINEYENTTPVLIPATSPIVPPIPVGNPPDIGTTKAFSVKPPLPIASANPSNPTDPPINVSNPSVLLHGTMSNFTPPLPILDRNFIVTPTHFRNLATISTISSTRVTPPLPSSTPPSPVYILWYVCDCTKEECRRENSPTVNMVEGFVISGCVCAFIGILSHLLSCLFRQFSTTPQTAVCFVTAFLLFFMANVQFATYQPRMDLPTPGTWRDKVFPVATLSLAINSMLFLAFFWVLRWRNHFLAPAPPRRLFISHSI